MEFTSEPKSKAKMGNLCLPKICKDSVRKVVRIEKVRLKYRKRALEICKDVRIRTSNPLITNILTSLQKISYISPSKSYFWYSLTGNFFVRIMEIPNIVIYNVV